MPSSQVARAAATRSAFPAHLNLIVADAGLRSQHRAAHQRREDVLGEVGARKAALHKARAVVAHNDIVATLVLGGSLLLCHGERVGRCVRTRTWSAMVALQPTGHSQRLVAGYPLVHARGDPTARRWKPMPFSLPFPPPLMLAFPMRKHPEAGGRATEPSEEARHGRKGKPTKPPPALPMRVSQMR